MTIDQTARERHIVALSGGKDSTAMALRLAEVEPREYEYICTPTGNELPAMVNHWIRLGQLLDKPLKPVGNGHSLASLIKDQNCLPNHRMRWCTRILKIEPFQQYVFTQSPCTTYVGLRADEGGRDGVDHGEFLGVTNRYPLREWGWGLREVQQYLIERGVEIPRRTDCGLCFFQRIYEWYVLWRDEPEQWATGEECEAMVGHTFRSPGRDTWPLSMKDLAAAFASGRIPKERTGMDDRKTMCSTCAR